MPPRLQLHPKLQVLSHRPKRLCVLPRLDAMRQCRGFADQDGTAKKEDQNPLPHVSEEAAATSKITGKEGPDISQGTPVEEVVKGDKEAEKHLPQVMKDEMKQNKAPKGSRSYSTSACRMNQEMQVEMSNGTPSAIISNPGHKFDLPTLPLPARSHLHHRYDPVVDQVTKLLMRDGKLSVAQRNMSEILTHLRTSPAPNVSSSRPLLPNAPPPSHLPLNPTLYLTLAIDSVAPLMRLRSQKGAAGGGMALQIPVPLGLRQRRRQAVMWILDSVDKRKKGLSPFAKRVAEEIVAIVEGRSSVWERRANVHRLGVSARANLGFLQKSRR